MARNPLPLTGYEAARVLVPSEGAREEVLRISVLAPGFPQRAVEPELWVGRDKAQRVAISMDQRRLRGYFAQTPEEGGQVRVRYGDSLEGVLEEPFSRKRVRPLPTECGG